MIQKKINSWNQTLGNHFWKYKLISKIECQTVKTTTRIPNMLGHFYNLNKMKTIKQELCALRTNKTIK